ncbi:DUF3224 domain-containing protein [Massilia antarctica]|uniref:DUF3224 domain-containing protein n=1 Tax=Massilia antarctica TaxID=2765360 RepID=UPI0006BB59B8|nr:DUF3224 domain-containing protein [Massilia sp. H27-R4]MCY0911870.1 DUF3224 domain-containing protein [Massilia sp. H27-R4]CUI06674.1 hypothetical protein BN2497_8125 [Janthinobacterium sp. CG23_2]CUU30460.1 hypothetical protein BN3177_8125 [Janthinobacterium sp. CG23_2]
MFITAKGTFEITMQAPPSGEGAGRVSLGRMLIDKYYSGDLIGIGQGEMLSAGNPAAGSAGYVAIEHVTGTLDGMSGSFALQHAGTMHAGASHLSISIVPGSGTEGLSGIQGKFKLDIVDSKHYYELEYTMDVV